MTGSCREPVAMLLTPPSARALLQALSRCLVFDASAAAMLLAASAPQPKLLQVSPVLPATASSSSPDAARDGRTFQEQRQKGPSDATALVSNADVSQLEDLSGSRSEQQNDSSSASLPASRPHSAGQPQAAGIPLALQLITKRESYEAVCGVACVLGHIAALHGRLPRHGPPACLAPVLCACTCKDQESIYECTAWASSGVSRTACMWRWKLTSACLCLSLAPCTCHSAHVRWACRRLPLRCHQKLGCCHAHN